MGFGRAEGAQRRPAGPAGLAAGVLCLTVLGYGLGCYFYLRGLPSDQNPGRVTLAVPDELMEEAGRLVESYAALAGRGVVLVEAGRVDGPAADPAALVASGAVDCALVLTGFPERAGPGRPEATPAGTIPAPGSGPLYRAVLLSVPFPSPLTGLSLAEAAGYVATGTGGPTDTSGQRGFGTSSWVTAVGLRGRSPDRQLLAVDGVYPTLDSVADGSYALSAEVRLIVRSGPRGLLGLPGKLGPVRRWLWPDEEGTLALAAWFGGPESRAAFYGQPFEVSLAAAGDVMLSRNVGKAIDENGLEWPFGLVGERLGEADVTYCNLESPLGTSGEPLPGKGIWFRASPKTVTCLTGAGIDVVSLANNHILDYDSPCLLETIDILDSHGIAHAGAGEDMAAARAPAIVEVPVRTGLLDPRAPAGDGVFRVAFLSYTEFAKPDLFWDVTYRRTFLAGEGVPGCAPLDMSMVAEDVPAALEVADFVVVCYHWGMENEPYPLRYDPKNDLDSIARRTIDLGAGLVLGTHPHAVQGLEVYRGGVIAYSLGNFVMDQKRDTQKEGLVLEVRLGPTGVLSARLLPVWIDTTRPRFLEGDEAKGLLEKVEVISRPFRGGP